MMGQAVIVTSFGEFSPPGLFSEVLGSFSEGIFLSLLKSFKCHPANIQCCKWPNIEEHNLVIWLHCKQSTYRKPICGSLHWNANRRWTRILSLAIRFLKVALFSKLCLPLSSLLVHADVETKKGFFKKG